MTKLYISYYGDYISIVEGAYKKNKFNIKDILFMSSDEIDKNYNDKYDLLKYALKSSNYKSKKAILCLNTIDVIVKSNKIPKINPKDLDGIMSMEIDEMISLERDEYIFSYEVMKEIEDQGEEQLDLILAGVEKNEVKNILSIFDEHNINLECIDILPAAYSRLLKEIEYTDMMIVNTGEYSTSIDIYKEDSLYIHDNVPVRLTEDAQIYDYMRLVDEANGLMNYYSSRNFGKIVDNIVVVGTHAHNKEVQESFKKMFASEIISGIENLYDIDEEIKGNILEADLNMIVDNIGCMIRDKYKSPYLKMNLLPNEIRRKQERRKRVIRSLEIAPLILIILYIPIMAFNLISGLKQNQLNDITRQIDQLKIHYSQISDIEEKINKKEEEIKIYDMLIKKEPKWEVILNSIDENIPYKVQLDTLGISYVSDKEKRDNQSLEDIKLNEKEENEKSDKEKEQPLYEKIPNFITMIGKADTPSHVGQFVYKLKELPYFENVKLSGVSEQKVEGQNGHRTSYNFSITADVKDGVITNE